MDSKQFLEVLKGALAEIEATGQAESVFFGDDDEIEEKLRAAIAWYELEVERAPGLITLGGPALETECAVATLDASAWLSPGAEANVRVATADADLELQPIHFPTPAASWGRVSGSFMTNPRWRWWSFWRPRLLYIPVKGQGTTL